jgi:transcriptional antiterminator NusG
MAQAAEESAPSELVTAESPAAESEEPESAAKPKRSRKPKTAAAATAADATTMIAPTATVTPTEEPAEGTENKKKWYAIKVQSGREESIKAAILRKVAIEGLEEFLGRIEIPVEEVIEKKQVKVKDKKTGESTYQEKKVTRKKKKFHGYIFAELEFNDRILYLFRETSGVGDFLNMRSGKGKLPVPEPMSDNEVKAMLTGEVVKDRGKGGKTKVKVEFEKGDRVKIREGPFANSEGEVKSITEPKDPTESPKVTVVVTLWGRPVDVELEYWQVEKV